MNKTEKADWWFIIPASLIFFSALGVTVWDFFCVQNMTYRLDLINITGFILFFAGITLRRVAKRILGEHYSYTVKKTQKIITRSIYSHIRHPIYLAMFVYAAGIPLIFSSLCGFFIMLGLIPCTLYRIQIEEKMLLEEFGTEYRDYTEHSKKLIPYIY
jgi:protein-S-isoprenylcysteine O-methyltransferase Ste14